SAVDGDFWSGRVGVSGEGRLRPPVEDHVRPGDGRQGGQRGDGEHAAAVAGVGGRDVEGDRGGQGAGGGGVEQRLSERPGPRVGGVGDGERDGRDGRVDASPGGLEERAGLLDRPIVVVRGEVVNDVPAALVQVPVTLQAHL